VQDCAHGDVTGLPVLTLYNDSMMRRDRCHHQVKSGRFATVAN
jgi:hypothetical protein